MWERIADEVHPHRARPPDADCRRRELIEISAITHAHIQCTDCCVAYGEIVNALLEGAEVPDALAAARALGPSPQGPQGRSTSIRRYPWNVSVRRAT